MWSIRKYLKHKKRKAIVNHLQKKGLDVGGMRVGLEINDVRLTLSDGVETYSAKILINGNNIELTTFERAK